MTACPSACLYAAQHVRLGLACTGSHFWFCFEAEAARQEDVSWGRMSEPPAAGVWYEDSWGLDPSLSWSYLWPPDGGTRGHRGPYRSLLFSSVQRHSYTLHSLHTNSDTRTHSHTRRSMAVVLGISALFREPDHFGSQTALHHTTYTVYNSAKCSLFMIPMRRPIFHINYSIHTISIQK